jgi:hypothetical protein
MKTIPTFLEPPIWLDLKHLRTCNVRDCVICAELRRSTQCILQERDGRIVAEPCAVEHPLDVIERILS